MDDPYNLVYKIGDHLIIELNTQQMFEGDYSDGGKNRIDLVNVRQHNNRNELAGIFSFYRNEIVKIHRHKNAKVNKEEKKDIVVIEESNNIQLVEEEYNRLKEMCKNAIYLDQIDDRYFKSVEKLCEAETVGIISLGIDDPTDRIRLLVLCTWKQIYILDLSNFTHRKFYPEIKSILESEYITKVMHGGSLLINILYNSYDVYVKNIFDTQIVDLILVKSKTGTCPKSTTDISQCLVNYLKFPPSLMKDALSVSTKNWNERPLTEEKRFFAAQIVTYLIPLKECMERDLMHKVYKTIDDVHNLYFNLNNYNFSEIMQKNKVTKEIDNLIPRLSCNLNVDN